LDLATLSNDKVGIQVYDMNGKLVEAFEFENTADAQNQKIGAGYSSGIYNIMLVQRGNRKTIRVIKR
jgi:hypothetical protein